jgi:16S rRNA G966 N2-methylase RsmD
LDAIRKNSVNAAIEKLRPGMDATAQKRLAAEVLSDIKPLLIDAIEGAGGTGYRQYLANYTKGMQNIGQTKLGAQAVDLYKKSPQQFVDLVEGNSPEVVEKIFGSGNYDVAVEMSKDAMKTLKGAAKQVKTSAEMAKQATAGEQALVELMKDNAINLKLPNVFNVVATTTNKTLDIVGKIVTKRTMTQLTEAAKTAKSFDELLNTLPASERNAILKALKDPKNWQGAKKMGEKFTGVGAMGVNALSREQENENALVK